MCRKNYDEYIGKKFGRLTIKEIFYVDNDYIKNLSKNASKVYCNCICDCGKEKTTLFKSVKSGKTGSCGCLIKEKGEKISLKRTKNIIGMKFNRLLVIESASPPLKIISHYKPKYWLCKCDCGEEIKVASKHLVDGSTKSCGCLQLEKMTGINYLDDDYKYIMFLPYLNGTKNNKRLKESTITLKDLNEVWEYQNGICPFTGVKLLLKTNMSKNNGIYTASLDRIDNTKGYIKGNIRFVSMMMNFAKNRFGDCQLEELCKNIANHWKDRI